jgi:hypothetical protein
MIPDSHIINNYKVLNFRTKKDEVLFMK